MSPGAPLVDVYTLKVRVQGQHIQAFVDDQPSIYIYDTSYPAGRYGLFSRSVGGSEFEDLEVIGDIRPFVAVEPVPSISFPGLALFAGLVLGIGGWGRRGS